MKGLELMAIVSWPYSADLPSSLVCVICNQDRPPSEVSAGLCNANGEQAFACNAHFWFGSQFIMGWARFAAQQRKLLSQKVEAFLDGVKNGWMLR